MADTIASPTHSAILGTQLQKCYRGFYDVAAAAAAVEGGNHSISVKCNKVVAVYYFAVRPCTYL